MVGVGGYGCGVAEGFGGGGGLCGGSGGGGGGGGCEGVVGGGLVFCFELALIEVLQDEGVRHVTRSVGIGFCGIDCG